MERIARGRGKRKKNKSRSEDLDALEFLGVALLPGVLLFDRADERRSLLVARRDTDLVRDRVADDTGLELHDRLDDLAIFDGLADLEDGEGLDDGEVDGRVCELTTSADTATETEREGVCIGLRCTTVDAKETLRLERHWVVEHRWVMRETPDEAKPLKSALVETRKEAKTGAHQMFGNKRAPLGMK